MGGNHLEGPVQPIYCMYSCTTKFGTVLINYSGMYGVLTVKLFISVESLTLIE